MTHGRPLLAVFAMTLGAFLFLATTGVSLVSSAAIVGVLLVQSWGGWVLWSTLRSRASWPELTGMAIAIGTAASALAAVVVRVFVDTTFGWLTPAIVGITVVVYRHLRRLAPLPTRTPIDPGMGFAIGFGLIAGVAGLLFVTLRNYPLAWTGTSSSYHGDMLFFEALGSSLAGWGPLDSIFSPEMVVRYHWLVYGWTGFLTDATAIEPFVALTRVVPLITLVVAVLLAAAWTRRLTTVAWAPLLAVALIVTGGYVGASYGTVLNFDSPSTSFTTVWLMAAILIVLTLFHRESGRTPTLVMTAILSAAITAGKVSTGLLLVSTLLVIAFVTLIRKATWRQDAVIATVTGGGAALTAYLLAIAGSADPGGLDVLSLVDRASSVQGLNPIPGYLGAALGTVVLALAIAIRWAGVLWLWRDTATRWSPASIAALGLVVGGLMPLLLVSGGINETWFALSASAPLSVLSAAGVARCSALIPSLRILLAVGSAGVIWLALWILWNSGPSGGNIWEYTARWAGPLVAIAGAIAAGFALSRGLGVKGAAFSVALIVAVFTAVPGRLLALGPAPAGVQPGTRGELFGSTETFADGRDQVFVMAWSDSEAQAGRILHGATSRDDLIATNHTFSPLVSALSGRQTYVSGMHYQAPYGWPRNVATLVDREAHSWDFINTPSSTTWAPLCTAGVNYLWVDPERTDVSDWNPWGKPIFVSPRVVIIEIHSDRLAQCS